MSQALYAIDEYIATIRKKTSIWIVFNTTYNDVHAFNKNIKEGKAWNYLNKDNTDYDAQKEFLLFIKRYCPDVKIFQVFDLASSDYLVYPYLGSYAIDIDIGSTEYQKIVEKYGNPYDKTPPSNNAVLWVMDYEDAQKFHEEREAMLDK